MEIVIWSFFRGYLSVHLYNNPRLCRIGDIYENTARMMFVGTVFSEEDPFDPDLESDSNQNDASQQRCFAGEQCAQLSAES